MEDIIYFELDNWTCGLDYPNAEPFTTWMSDSVLIFNDDLWCKNNELCVLATIIDMSVCFLISAKRSWVEKHCPKLLTDEDCSDKESTIATSKYSNFVYKPDENGDVYGSISGLCFRNYCKENYGVIWEEDKED